MKKNFLIPIFLLVLAINLSASCEENQFFGSLGCIYAVTDFKDNSKYDLKVNLDFDYCLGLNAKFGYSIQDILSFGLETEFIVDPDSHVEHTDAPSSYIKHNDKYDTSKTLMETNLCKSLFTLLPFLKISLPGKYKPYMIGGAGMIYQHSHLAYTASYFSDNKTIEYLDTSYKESKTDNAFCGKG